MIERKGVYMANHSSGWFALINVLKYPLSSDDDFEFIYGNNGYAITDFQQLLAYQSRFIPIVGYNARVAVTKIFEGK